MSRFSCVICYTLSKVKVGYYYIFHFLIWWPSHLIAGLLRSPSIVHEVIYKFMNIIIYSLQRLVSIRKYHRNVNRRFSISKDRMIVSVPRVRDLRTVDILRMTMSEIYSSKCNSIPIWPHNTFNFLFHILGSVISSLLSKCQSQMTCFRHSG